MKDGKKNTSYDAKVPIPRAANRQTDFEYKEAVKLGCCDSRDSKGKAISKASNRKTSANRMQQYRDTYN